MIGRRAAPSAEAVAEKPRGFDGYDLRLGDLMRGERATLGKSLLDVQRELKIKATYIAAIENADVSAFETPGFIAGYVRSYARYLGMNPDHAFDKFCREANFAQAHGLSQAASTQRVAAVRNRAAEFRDPFAEPRTSFVPQGERFWEKVQPGAVGSIVVLALLIGGIGYGGWSILQEVQRVQLAPVDQAPRVVAEIDPLGNVPGMAPLVRSAPAAAGAADPGLATPGPVVSAPALAAPTLAATQRATRAEQPAALAVPILTPRDGPIASIDLRREGDAIDDAVAEALADADPVQVTEASAPGVSLLAVRPSWVRVSAADGTVLFEKTLDAGEVYDVPLMEEPATLRAGNSGSVYFRVNGQTFGPAAPGAQVVKNIALSPEALMAAYVPADPEQDTDLRAIITKVAEAAPVPAEPVAD